MSSGLVGRMKGRLDISGSPCSSHAVDTASGFDLTTRHVFAGCPRLASYHTNSLKQSRRDDWCDHHDI